MTKEVAPAAKPETQDNLWTKITNFFELPDWVKMEEFQNLMTKILHVLIWLVIAYLLLKIICRIVKKVTQYKMSPQASNLTVKIVKQLGFIIMFVESFSLLGFDILTILGAASIIGVAVGFASQTSLSNIISGLFLVGERQINLGDTIEIQGIRGQVDSINLMSVLLRLPNNTLVRVPNEMIIKNPVSNITRFSTRRYDLDVGVDYNADMDHVEATIRDVLQEHPMCLNDPAPTIIFTGFQDSSLGYKIGAWCSTDDYMKFQLEIPKQIKKRFDQEGISIPFPIRSLESRSPIQVQIQTPDNVNSQKKA